jgi:hypothetical protein
MTHSFFGAWSYGHSWFLCASELLIVSLLRIRQTAVSKVPLTNCADPKNPSVGQDNIAMVTELLESFAIWPFTEVLGWTAAEVHMLVESARSELRDASLKLYIPV